MKKFTAIVLVALLALSATSAFAAEKIVIGATPMPHAMILEFIKPDFEALGYELQIVESSDYYLFNPATAAGDTNGNYFQHTPFLDSYNNDPTTKEEDKLVSAFAVHYEPLGLYGGTKKTLDEIADGDVISVPNDASNMKRALLLLQDAGIVKLSDEAATKEEVTSADFVENPHNITIQDMNAELLASSLADVAYAVINSNHAIAGGLNPTKDSLIIEPSEGVSATTYANILAVRTEDADAQWVKDLKSVMLTDKVREYILTEPAFGGGVVPMF